MNKKINAIVIASVLIVLSAILAFAILFPYANVSFSGIHMVINEADTTATTQGFVDITLKNVNATGVSYCLQYDTTKLQLSTVADNKPITVSGSGTLLIPTEFNLKHEYFEQNTDLFPAGVFQDDPNPAYIAPGTSIIGAADPTNGYVLMNFIPDRSGPACDKIGTVESGGMKKLAILADTEDLLIGRISFKILDAAAFSKMTKEQLEKAIKVVPFSKMLSTYTSVDDDSGIHISYLDDNGDDKWHSSAEQNISYDFEIKPDLAGVEPLISEIKVSSYDIYKTGTIQDLLDFLNERMSEVILTYTDTSKIPALFTWTSEESNIGSLSWDPHGDKIYEISQPYSTIGTVNVKVTVTPIKLMGFTADNTPKTYVLGSASFPTQFSDLELATETNPVFDTYIPNYGIGAEPIGWYSLPPDSSQASALPAGFDTTAATYNYLGHLDTTTIANLPTKYPWLTITSVTEVPQVRNVVATEDDVPKTLEVESTVDENGILTIKVNYPEQGGLVDPIPPGTTFKIKMPNGELIDTMALGSQYNLNIITDTGDPDYGKAIITLSPSISIPSQQKIAQYINLGNRAEGKFAISAKESGSIESEFTKFTHEPRINYYLKNSANDDYVYDYSKSLSSMFRVKAGTTLPTTITLPIKPPKVDDSTQTEDFVGTTYNGESGLMPGELQTITVEAWSVESGDTTLPGSVVTVRGKLADTSYTNYGKVINNPSDPVYVTVIYYVVENDGEDKIDAIADFAYDKQQVGYGHDLIQTEEFTINNSGPKTIYGLSVQITPNGTDPEAFVLTKMPQSMMDSGATDTFKISTKPGLPAREGDPYTATVSVMSNNKVLRTFQISFEVTEQPIYQIKLTIPETPVDQRDFGSVKTSTETYTSEAGKTITIIAEPADDCTFVGWTVVLPSGTDSSFFTYPTAGDLTVAEFVMPDSNVEIKAEFEESPEAMLRATELMVRPAPTPSEEPPFTDIGYPLYEKDEDGIWSKIAFDPVKREYLVTVPNATDKVKLWFKLRDPTNTTVSLTQEEYDPSADTSTTPVTLTPPAQNFDPYYDSDAISLVEGPTVNVIKLKLSKTGADDRYYTLKIYRQLKVFADFKYGNSPYGLIMKDDTKFPDLTAKNAAKTAFADNDFTFVTAANTPDGATEGTSYSKKAWGTGANYDTDQYALFIDQSSNFKDPGYSGTLKNSIGEDVTGAVTKTITVQELTDTVNKDGSPDDFAYISPKEITLPSTGDIDFTGSILRIRPDIYEIVYSYMDFDGSTKKVTRPAIVLSPLGDINVDHSITAADEDRIINRFKTELADDNNIPVYSGVPSYDKGGLIFKYRICDTNKDAVINAIDANPIYADNNGLPPGLIPFYVNFN